MSYRIARTIPKWKFATFSVIPVVAFFIVVEVVLRLVGFSYNPQDLTRNLFVDDGRGARHRNPEFPKVAYAGFPLFSQKFQREKPSRLFRCVLIGASNVYLLNHAPDLKELLAESLGQPVEIINMGIPGVDSERCIRSIKEAILYDPDIIILYTGHNEFTAMSNPLTYKDPPFGLTWLPQHSRVVQAIWCVRNVGVEDSGKSHKNTRGTPRLYSQSEKEDVYHRFRENVSEMTRIAARARVGLVLGTVSSNFLSPPLLRISHRLWHKDYSKEVSLQSRIQDRSCTMLWSMGFDRWQADEFDEGRALMSEAFLHSPRPERADSRINEIIRFIAQESQVPLADVEGRISAEIDSVPSSKWFIDNCHLNAAGRQIQCQLFAEQVINLLQIGRVSTRP